MVSPVQMSARLQMSARCAAAVYPQPLDRVSLHTLPSDHIPKRDKTPLVERAPHPRAIFQSGISRRRDHASPIIFRRNSLRPQHSPRYRELLKRLRQARHDAGLTQAEVAEALGTTQGYVSKCEQGERRVDAIELSDFAQVYGAAVDSLLPLSTAPRLASRNRLRRVAEPRIRPKDGRRSEPK